MKIKEVQAGVKISKDYNSYSVNLIADIESEESPEKVGDVLIERASEIVNKKIIELSKKTVPAKRKYLDREKEIGAAWPDKKFSNRLSVKNSATGEWSDVMIADLEKTDEGFKQKTDEGVLVFRKLSDKERKNDKMPLYRIYKIGVENEE